MLRRSRSQPLADGEEARRSRSQPPADGEERTLHSVRSRSRGSVRSLDESAQPRRLRSKSQPRVQSSSATAEMRGRGRSSLGAVDARPLTRRSCSRTPRGSRSPLRRDSSATVERVYTYCVPALPFSATSVRESRRASRDAANLRGKRRALHQILGSLSQSRGCSEGPQDTDAGTRPSPEHGSTARAGSQGALWCDDDDIDQRFGRLVPAGKGDNERARERKGGFLHRTQGGKDGAADGANGAEGGSGALTSCLKKPAPQSSQTSATWAAVPPAPFERHTAVAAPHEEGLRADASQGESAQVVNKMAASLRGQLASGIQDVSKLEQTARCVRALREYVQMDKGMQQGESAQRCHTLATHSGLLSSFAHLLLHLSPSVSLGACASENLPALEGESEQHKAAAVWQRRLLRESVRTLSTVASSAAAAARALARSHPDIILGLAHAACSSSPAKGQLKAWHGGGGGEDDTKFWALGCLATLAAHDYHLAGHAIVTAMSEAQTRIAHCFLLQIPPLALSSSYLASQQQEVGGDWCLVARALVFVATVSGHEDGGMMIRVGRESTSWAWLLVGMLRAAATAQPFAGRHFGVQSVLQAAVRLAANCRLAPGLVSAGFVDACGLAVLRTISSSPFTATLGVGALTHMAFQAAAAQELAASQGLLHQMCVLVSGWQLQAGTGQAHLERLSLVQSLRDLVVLVKPSLLDMLPLASKDDSSRTHAHSDHAGQTHEILVMAVGDGIERRGHLLEGLSSWGFQCCCLGAVDAGDKGGHGGMNSSMPEHGDAQMVAARCAAAVVVISRDLLLCARSRLVLAALARGSTPILSVLTNEDKACGWSAQVCLPDHAVTASSTKQLLKCLVRKLLALDVPSETQVTRQTSPSRAHTLSAPRRMIAGAGTDGMPPGSPTTLGLRAADLGRKEDHARGSAQEGLCALCGASGGNRGLEDGKMLKDLLDLARAQQAILKSAGLLTPDLEMPTAFSRFH